jgi:hypothetical protein
LKDEPLKGNIKEKVKKKNFKAHSLTPYTREKRCVGALGWGLGRWNNFISTSWTSHVHKLDNISENGTNFGLWICIGFNTLTGPKLRRRPPTSSL